MAFSEAERADIRMRLGWSERFFQYDSRLEQAMNAMATRPDGEALVRAELARCSVIDVELDATHSRFKADTVGSIKLNRREAKQLYREGRRATRRIAAILGVERRIDTYGGGDVSTFAGFGGTYGGDNYIGF